VRNARALQQGFSLVTAIFLLVILSALGVFIVRVGSMQHMGLAYDVQGSRAYQAARAGIEWGLYQSLQGGACAGTTSFVPGAISEYTVTVNCAATTADEVGTTVNVYALTATACNQPSAGACPGTVGNNYVERQITSVAAK
jgi:MSHA biogenesis protein MshP